KNGPFFLNYWMFSVHAPFDAKKALIEKYRGRVDPADPQRCPTYAAMVESLDDAVGTLIDTLDRLGIAERTLIIFFSDNGGNMYNEVDGTTPTSNAPLRGGKATVYEGGVREPCIVSYPGVVAAGCRSDAVIQSSDFYPTILDVLGLKPQPDQHFDGISIVPALKGQSLSREAIFTFFPHDPGVPDWLPPAVTVHRGDWKLIRIFHGGEHGAHRWKLFNLRDDIGETTDLAAKEPERVKTLDALIERFLGDTKAVVPVPNPAFNPAAYHPEDEGKQKQREKAKPKAKTQGNRNAAASSADDPKLQGWKARSCTANVNDGIVTLTGKGGAPFLGFAAGKLVGPTVVRFRVSSATGGGGKVEWLPTPQATEKAKSVPFHLTAGDWQEMTVALPAEGALGIVRLYLPAQKAPVQLDWIELQSGKEKRRSDF
ncbi:MAG: sulfatase-like hydrolase/transferase, partial [Rhodopirellula sp.]|nr:sulfatase-like hydrolase/transferase [Rhodopirellula sp.]